MLTFASSLPEGRLRQKKHTTITFWVDFKGGGRLMKDDIYYTRKAGTPLTEAEIAMVEAARI